MRRLVPAALVVLVAVAGCGQRLVLNDMITVPVPVSGTAAAQALTARLSPSLLAELGGSVPNPWPASAPRVAEDLPLVSSLQVKRADLGAVGSDLSAVASGQAVLRLRGGDVTFDPGTLTQTVVAGVVYVGPPGVTATTDDGVARVGHLTGLGAGQGTLVFDPGGRHALSQGILADEATLLVRLIMPFDTAENPARPAGDGTVRLDLHVDVLK